MLYVNGIAVGVLELKRSTVSVAQGIRQNLDNQKKDFIQPFFTTVQFVMAGNDTEGVRYGVIETREKYWLRWKEAGAPETDAPLLPDLGHLCTPARLLELLHDFVVFDAGVKKICRHNQYFGVKAAQEIRPDRREGGIIWHTQGSGKSLTMVWLAKWIRELKGVDGRVLIVTDRKELDEQIQMVFERRGRGHPPDDERSGPGPGSASLRQVVDLFAHPEVRQVPGRRHRPVRQRSPKTPATRFSTERRDLRLRGRVSPHAVR